MPDNDVIVLEEIKETVFALDKAYRRAVNASDVTAMTALKPQVDDAFDSYTKARLKLFADGVIATDQDVLELRNIRADIDQAADTHALIIGAVKFIALIAAFV